MPPIPPARAPRPCAREQARDREQPRGRRTARWSLRLAAILLSGGLVLGTGTPALADDGAVTDHEATAAEGEAVTVDLMDGAEGVTAGSARLLLDGLPSGSTLTSDGRRAQVPSQGTWQLSTDGTSLTFTPIGPRLGREPSPIRYTARDASGDAVTPAVVTVSTPVIQDMVRSAPFGQSVDLPVSEVDENVVPGSLRLVAAPGVQGVELAEDGTRATVPGQGTWALDRATGHVRFTPDSDAVHTVNPIGIRGSDADGAETATALLSIGYAALTDRVVAEHPGSVVQFAPMDGSRNVRADSLRFLTDGAPDGAQLSKDGLTLTVSGQGTWTLDLDARIARFTPEEGVTASPDPVPYGGLGLYADNPVSAMLVAEYTAYPPTARADQLRGRPGEVLSVDLLANDTPGRASDPLRARTVRLFSPRAANADELTDGTGTRLVVPGEGEYTVRGDGVLTFVPESGFRGTGGSVEYVVEDSAGIVVTAPVSVDVDPQAPAVAAGGDAGGINSMLEGIRPSRTPTFTVFATVAALLVFAGAASLWIGGRMEADRRSLRG